MFSPLRWLGNALELLDQNQLPEKEVWLTYDSSQAVAEAITTMVVRGAPAIGIAAAYGFVLATNEALQQQNPPFENKTFLASLKPLVSVLRESRPTAVNLMWALDRMQYRLEKLLHEGLEGKALLEPLQAEATAIHQEDQQANQSMGELGAALLPEASVILTHCNAGALATGGYGTALGVIRAAYATGRCSRVYADETRPRLQGAKLTAYELHKENIPTTLICDNMAASLMRQTTVDAVIVGADRIAANGDVANKIGTYSLALVAKAHNVPFYVAAPLSTFDISLVEGTQIPIEQRCSSEITHVGATALAPEGIDTFNPAFDITPAHLISAIITPEGVLYPPYTESIASVFAKQQTQASRSVVSSAGR